MDKRRIRELFGAAQSDVLHLLSSGFPLTHLIFLSTYIDVVRSTGKNHFLTLNPDSRLEKLNCFCKDVPLNDFGQVTKEALKHAIGPRTVMASLPWADSFTGVINPIVDLVDVCKAKDVLFHVDASAVIGKLFFHLEDLPIDFFSFDLGILSGVWSKKAIPELPECSDTEDLELEMERRMEQFDHLCTETARLRDKLESAILQNFEDVEIIHRAAERLPHITALRFEGVNAEALSYFLSKNGIDVKCRDGAISLTLTYETNEKDVEKIFENVAKYVKKLRSFFYDYQ